MRYAQIRDMDVSNGVGIACSLFVQGCNHHCPECFNKETWDWNGGQEWSKEIEDKFIKLCKIPYIDCVSILGGEPFQQDDSIYYLLKRLKKEVNKPVYLWTGYTLDEALKLEIPRKCIEEKLINVIVDGKFVADEKDLNLKLRGSKNQNIINITTVQN